MKLKTFGYIFLSIGTLVLALAFKIGISTKSFLAESQVLPGKVIKLDQKRSRNSNGHLSSSYYPVVEYLVDGETKLHYSLTGSRPPKYSVNDSVEILYNPISKKAKIKSFFFLWFPTCILTFLGSIFTLVGAPILYFPYKRKKDITFLRRRGAVVPGTVTSIKLNQRVSVNNQNPWVVECSGNYHSREMTFKSDYIWGEQPKLNAGDHITIRINPKKISSYYVDIPTADTDPQSRQNF